MIKIKENNIKYSSQNSSFENKNKYIITEKDIPELTYIIKRKREELNTQIKKLKIENNIMDNINKKLKVELFKLNKINKHMISIEKEIEIININISKINKKKLYYMSSIIKVKNQFKSTNINKKYLSILNIGLNNKENK